MGDKLIQKVNRRFYINHWNVVIGFPIISGYECLPKMKIIRPSLFLEFKNRFNHVHRPIIAETANGDLFYPGYPHSEVTSILETMVRKKKYITYIIPTHYQNRIGLFIERIPDNAIIAHKLYETDTQLIIESVLNSVNENLLIVNNKCDEDLILGMVNLFDYVLYRTKDGNINNVKFINELMTYCGHSGTELWFDSRSEMNFSGRFMTRIKYNMSENYRVRYMTTSLYDEHYFLPLFYNKFKHRAQYFKKHWIKLIDYYYSLNDVRMNERTVRRVLNFAHQHRVYLVKSIDETIKRKYKGIELWMRRIYDYNIKQKDILNEISKDDRRQTVSQWT